MKVYLPKSFQRQADKEGVSDEACREAVRKAEKGLVDAPLGGGLIKQRIPTGNRGAAKGSRAIIFYRRGELAIFLHIFAKQRKANLTKSELAEYLKFARIPRRAVGREAQGTGCRESLARTGSMTRKNALQERRAPSRFMRLQKTFMMSA